MKHVKAAMKQKEPANKKHYPQAKRQKWKYVKENWQLYLIFMMPAFLLTIIFKYIPMGGMNYSGI